MTQPKPKLNDSQPVVDKVVKDLLTRKELGRRKYGTPLQAFNGRDSMMDAYEELLDLTIYFRQVLEERNNDQDAGTHE